MHALGRKACFIFRHFVLHSDGLWTVNFLTFEDIESFLITIMYIVQGFLTTQLEVATGEKEPRPGTWTRSPLPNAEFQLRKPPVWPRFSNSNHRIYTVTGGPQYCDHLRPAPEGSVRWYTQRASSMCMCMSPRAWWKMVHHSYLYMLCS